MEKTFTIAKQQLFSRFQSPFQLSLGVTPQYEEVTKGVSLPPQKETMQVEGPQNSKNPTKMVMEASGTAVGNISVGAGKKNLWQRQQPLILR
jgi:hypothetical protein